MSKVIGLPKFRLDNGAKVLQYTELHEGGNGHNRHGVAVCAWDDRHDPFVVWTIYNRKGETVWYAEGGNYCQTLQEAVEIYENRGGL